MNKRKNETQEEKKQRNEYERMRRNLSKQYKIYEKGRVFVL